MFLKRHHSNYAPEIPKHGPWINGPTTKEQEPAAKVTLLYFWNATTPAYKESIDHIRRWQHMYGPHGVRIVGIYTPQVSFEKKRDWLEKTVSALRLNIPVYIDEDFRIVSALGITHVPYMCLVDAHRAVLFTHAGQNGSAHMEFAMQSALHSLGEKNLPSIISDDAMAGKIVYPKTADFSCGYLHGHIENPPQSTQGAPVIVPNQESAFTDTQVYKDGCLYLHGHWAVWPEHIVHTRQVARHSEYIAVRYSACCVYAMVNSQRETIVVTLNRLPIPEDMMGRDVQKSEDEETVLCKEGPGIFELVRAPMFHQGVLRIESSAPGFECFGLKFL